MNNDKIKGAVDDAAGRVKRQVGEWTGDTSTQVDGAAQQVKGKMEKAVGNLRDAVKPGATRDVETNRDIDDNTGRETVREREEIDRE
jgi:uncharacterized protein YjbJ (UPF0337 family)